MQNVSHMVHGMQPEIKVAQFASAISSKMTKQVDFIMLHTKCIHTFEKQGGKNLFLVSVLDFWN